MLIKRRLQSRVISSCPVFKKAQKNPICNTILRNFKKFSPEKQPRYIQGTMMPKCLLLSYQSFRSPGAKPPALKPQDRHLISKYMTYKWYNLGQITELLLGLIFSGLNGANATCLNGPCKDSNAIQPHIDQSVWHKPSVNESPYYDHPLKYTRADPRPFLH